MRAHVVSVLCVAFLVAGTGVKRAAAHQTESQRSVVVQLEDDKALLLVSWTAPSGLLGSLMVARASLSQDPRATLERLMTRRALGELSIEIDGRHVPLRGLDSKLTLDTSSLHRHTVTLLAWVDLPEHGNLAVSAHGSEVTRLAWANRRAHSALRSNRKPDNWNRAPIELAF